MGLLSFIGDLGGKLYRNVLSAQIRRNMRKADKATTTAYNPPVTQQVINYTPVIKPPVISPVEPSVGGFINPDKDKPVAPVESEDLIAENKKLKDELEKAQKQVEIMTKAITEGKVGAVSASKDPVKLQKQVETAIKAEQAKADKQAGKEIIVELDSPDMEYDELDDDGVTDEELERLGVMPWST
jgi:hypothetical protein